MLDNGQCDVAATCHGASLTSRYLSIFSCAIHIGELHDGRIEVCLLQYLACSHNGCLDDADRANLF